MALAQKRADSAKLAREAAEKRQASGDISELELLFVQGEEERARAEILRARGELEGARARLAARLGRRLEGRRGRGRRAGINVSPHPALLD
jgi:outer membrane protein TolC